MSEDNKLMIQINDADLDAALEKANRLKELLQEIHELIYSLGKINQKVR